MPKLGMNDDRCPLYYRGTCITLISVPCKIHCTVLIHCTREWLEDNEYLCDEHTGFCCVRSCEEQVFSLYSILNDRKNSHKKAMKKAFDTVRSDFLWYKLQAVGIHGKFLTAIKSLYEDVTCMLIKTSPPGFRCHPV